MNILGLNIVHMIHPALIINGKLICALEERFNKKNIQQNFYKCNL